MAIKIPRSHREPLRQLLTMDLALRQRFVDAIQAAGAAIDSQELIDQVSRTPELDEERIAPIIRMLITMFLAAGHSRSDFARNVVDEARGLFPDEAIDWTAATANLAKLLACEQTLGVAAKVAEIRSEHANVFCDARILSDIRPVFGDDVASGPIAGAIVHTLRVAYHTASKHAEIHIALDVEDLRQLRSLVDRALQKEECLKAEIVKTNMRYVGGEQG